MFPLIIQRSVGLLLSSITFRTNEFRNKSVYLTYTNEPAAVCVRNVSHVGKAITEFSVVFVLNSHIRMLGDTNGSSSHIFLCGLRYLSSVC